MRFIKGSNILIAAEKIVAASRHELEVHVYLDNGCRFDLQLDSNAIAEKLMADIETIFNE